MGATVGHRLNSDTNGLDKTLWANAHQGNSANSARSGSANASISRLFAHATLGPVCWLSELRRAFRVRWHRNPPPSLADTRRQLATWRRRKTKNNKVTNLYPGNVSMSSTGEHHHKIIIQTSKSTVDERLPLAPRNVAE